MSASRRGVIAAALAAPVVLRGARGQALKDVTFVTPFGMLVGYAPDFVASSAGYFAAEGLKVTIFAGSGSATAVQQVAAGRALIARTGGIDVVRAISSGLGAVRAVGSIAHTATWKVVSSPASPVRKPADLAGKTVGIVSANGSTENYIDIMLAGAGVPRDSVKRQVVGNTPGAWEMIGLKRIDCFICDAGVVIALRSRGTALEIMDVNPYASIPGQVYVASEEGIAKQGDALLGYLRAVKRAMIDIDADLKGTGQQTLDRLAPFGLEGLRQPADAIAGLREEDVLWKSRGEANFVKIIPEDWRRGWREMVAAGLAKEGDPDRAFTTAFSDRI